MRAPGLIGVLALAAMPALAQDKAGADSASLAVLDLCEHFATGDMDDAMDYATALGWMVNQEPSDGPYSSNYAGFRSFAGLGDGNLWVQAERYPGVVNIACSVGFDMAGPDADAQVAALNRLDWLDGELSADETGIYGTWSGNGHEPELVQAFQNKDGFVLRLTQRIRTDASLKP